MASKADSAKEMYRPDTFGIKESLCPNSPMKYLVENISWMNTKGWLIWCLSKPRDIFVLLLTGLVVLCTVSSALLLCHIFLLAALFVAGWVVSAMSRPNLTLPTLAAVTPTSIQPDDEWLSFAVSFKLLANDFGHFSIKSLFCVWWFAVQFECLKMGVQWFYLDIFMPEHKSLQWCLTVFKTFAEQAWHS